MSNTELKTRLAPTPSGFLHLGNVASFVLTYLLAKTQGWKILLRIDDLDQARYRPQYAEDVLTILSTLKLEVDEGPSSLAELENKWSQSHRQALYKQALARLVEQDALFACHCTRKDISAAQSPLNPGYPGTCRNLRHPLVPGVPWRLKTNAEPINLPGPTGSRATSALPPDLQNFVVKRRDDLPAYQVASVVDDLHFGVNRIVRGHDLWGSSLAQWQLLAFLAPSSPPWQFIHHGLLKNPRQEKLSKSQKAPPFWAYWERPRGRAAFWQEMAHFLAWPRIPQSLGDLLNQAREEPAARKRMQALQRLGVPPLP